MRINYSQNYVIPLEKAIISRCFPGAVHVALVFDRNVENGGLEREYVRGRFARSRKVMTQSSVDT